MFMRRLTLNFLKFCNQGYASFIKGVGRRVPPFLLSVILDVKFKLFGP